MTRFFWVAGGVAVLRRLAQKLTLHCGRGKSVGIKPTLQGEEENGDYD
jgi:hypothetical protein